MARQHRSLAITDDVILPLSAVSSSARLLEGAAAEQDNIVVITQASSLNQLAMEFHPWMLLVSVNPMGFSLFHCFSEIFGVTKPDGEILVSLTQDVHGLSSEKIRSSFEWKLAIAGFLEPEATQQKTDGL